MDERELAQMFINYLEESGNYGNFLAWAEEKEYDSEEIESDITMHFGETV